MSYALDADRVGSWYVMWIKF